MRNKTILYVASTLPIVTIKSNLDSWNVGKIILANNLHKETYSFLLKDRSDIRLISSPSGFYLNFFFLFKTLLFSKIFKKEIIFFHECCCTLFDLLINFINNKSKLFPQVTLDSLEKMNITEVNFHNKDFFLISLFLQKKRFYPLKLNKDNNCGFDVIWACNSYNSKINVFGIDDTKLFRNSRINRNKISKNKILILASRDFCADTELINIYLEIFNFFDKSGINYFVKDHPNISTRLNIPINSIDKYIPPEIPTELIDDDFQYVIGLCSTGLIYYSNRSISILYLLEENIELLEQRKLHLLSLPGGDLINFPKNYSEFYAYFI